ncbi:MAG: glycosyltransferase family 9 protein [Candidatus Eisenbacteria bacterium]
MNTAGTNRFPYRNVLVIQTGFVGDMVLTTPLIRALRRGAGREASITLLHAPRTEGIVRLCPHVDRLVRFDKGGSERGTASTLRLARRLRAERFDLVISPHRSVRSGLLAFATGAPRRVGFERYPSSLFYTDTVPYSRWESTFVRRKLRLLEPLGIHEEDETPEVYFGDAEAAEARRLLAGGNVRPPYAVLAVGSAWPTKQWPPERFGALVPLLEKRGMASVFVGGPGDREAGRRAAKTGGGADLTGEMSFEVLGALLHGASLFVGNDSGAFHLARGARTPAIALFGPTGPEQFRFDRLVRIVRSDAFCAPCSDHGSAECPLGHWICLPGITETRVAAEADRLLAEADRVR